MALVQTQFSLLVGANGFGFWHYRTADANAAIHAANYFNGVAPILNVGDFICINGGTSNEITSVVSITAGVVVVGAGSPVATTAEMAAAKAAEEKAAKEAAAKELAAKNHPAQAQAPAQAPAR